MPIPFTKQNFNLRKQEKRLTAQTKVECRFPGEIVTLLAVNASLSPITSEVSDGEIFYKGKLLLTVVYEDAEKNVCRSERGMEFSQTVREEVCTPATLCTLSLSSKQVTSRREGSGLYLTVVVNADILLEEERAIEFLSDGEGVAVKKEERALLAIHPFSGSVEADDEFDTEYLGDVLLHGESVNVTDCTAEEGVVAITGEIHLNVCALKEEGKLVSLERLIPFRTEVACEEAKDGFPCRAEVWVESAKITAEANEDKGKCRVTANFTLRAVGRAYEEKTVTLADDLFSTERELTLVKEEFAQEYPLEPVRFSERVSGTASLDGSIDFSDTLVCVLLASSEAEVHRDESGECVDGVLGATLIAKNAEGSFFSRRVELPYSLNLPTTQEGKKEVCVMPCGVSVRQRKEGEAEMEATLKFTVYANKEQRVRTIVHVEEGEAFLQNESAASIYLPRAGASLWETAKQLKRYPEDLQKSNPELTFPLTGEERILVYRERCEE